MDVGLLRSYAEQGLTRKQIAEAMGLPFSTVSNNCTKHGIKTKRPEKAQNQSAKQLQIIAMRQKGISCQKIADLIGSTRGYVGFVSRSVGIIGNLQTLDEAFVAETIMKTGFQYIGGYTGAKKNVLAMCPKCGGTFERQFHIFCEASKGQRACDCPICQTKRKSRTEENQKRRKEKAEHEARIKAEQRAKKKADLISRQVEARLAIHVCKNCGKEYSIGSTGYNSVLYCSHKCMKRWAMRIKNDRRIRKMKAREHDNDITLEKLFARDNGICYLCGRECDWNAVDDKGNALNEYPSIDHVIPVSKGGKHIWSNVKLAHRGCNTLKRDEIIPLG